MNTDTDALQERIARILNDEGWTFEGIHEPGDYDECEDCRLAVDPIAARIAEEVAAHDARVRRDAAREALDGLAEQYEHDAYIRAYRDRNYPEETP